ncbi:uncharacterized protein [Miscanthus floridulus]|uniref:uncharacterized protein n=1 Tax=Miscanthus floridulus TaxID=154761 RepID=UPI003458169E
MDTGRTESPPPVSAKTQGKRPVADEPAQKKRKTAATAPRKPGDISLNDDQTNRARRTAVFDSSDDDEILMNPPPSTKGPPRNPRVEEQTRVGKEVHEALTRRVPEQRAEGIAAQQTSEIPTGQAMEVPEQQTEADPERQAKPRLTEEEPRIPPPSTGVDPVATPGGLGRHRWFKKLNHQTKPAKPTTDPAPPAQIEQQPETGPRAVEMPVGHILESPSVREHVGEPIATPSGLDSHERLPTMVNELATAPPAMMELGAEKLSAPKEQPTVPDASEGMEISRVAEQRRQLIK